MTTRLVDRSRSLSWQSCPRKRFWNYEAYGRGVQPIKMSIPLVVGQCVHSGLAVILEGARTNFECSGSATMWGRDFVDVGVEEALKEYDKEVRARGFVLEESEEAAFVFNEQKALIEALIRVWALKRLPGFLEQWEVLEVEREDQFTLTEITKNTISTKEYEKRISDWMTTGEGIPNTYDKDEIVWMSRADGLLRERSSGDLYVLSFKTASEWNDFKDKEARIDMQGMSELYAIERRLRAEFAKDYGVDAEYAQAYPTLAGVQMEFLLKGRRSKDKESGRYLQDSILVRPYFKDGGGLLPDEWAWKYWTHCEGPHITSGGKRCQGDANHSLGKGWYRVPVWEKMPIKEWIQMLYDGVVQPEAGDPLEGLVVSPMPFFRHEDEIESWRLQMEGQETRIAEMRKGAATDWTNDMKFYLDRNFPQHRESCFKYGEKHSCQFLDVCFGNIGDPLESGLFQLRVPHHSPEQEQFEKEVK